MDWTVQDVIDQKDQMTFKVLLSSRTLDPRWSYTNTKKKGRNTWTRWYDLLGAFFEKRFGADWQESDKEFWKKFPFY